MNRQKYFPTETQHFQLTDKDAGIDLSCYALSYEDKSLYYNGYYRFGIYSKEYQSYFSTKYNCDPDEAELNVIEDIFLLLADKIYDDFGIDIELDRNENYYWVREPSKSTMVISCILDEHYDEEE